MAGPARVIIQLQADASGLTPGIEALENLGKVDADTGAKFKAVSKAFQERGKVLDQSASSTQKLAEASKSLSESITGGAIKKAVDDISKLDKETGEVAKEMVVLAKTVDLARQKLAQLKPGTAEFNKIKGEVDAIDIAFGKFNKTATSSRGVLRQYRETLLELEDAGLEGTKVFEELAVAAGQLEDQVGDTQARIKVLASDTFKFDAAIQALQGVAGGFAIAQGAAALFGEENEEVQQALLKVNAAMAILQGLQQLQNILQKQSAVSIAADIALKRIAIIQTNLQAAAESRFTVIRVAATAAQQTLNAVMAANPATVVLVAIGALAAGLLYLTSRTNDETEAQAALNRQLERTNQSINNQREIIDSLADADSRQLALLRARGIEGSALAREEIKLIQGQIQRNAQLIESSIGVAGAEETYTQAVADNNKLRSDLRIKEAELSQTVLKETTEALRKAAEEEKKLVSEFLRDQVAANEIAVSEATNSFRKFEAEVELIVARLRQTLANPELTVNERINAEVKAGTEIINKRKELYGQLAEIDSERFSRSKEFLNDEVLSGVAANQQRLANEQEAAQARIRIAEDEALRKEDINRRIAEAAYNTAISLAASLVEISRNENEAELQLLQTRLDKGLISQQQYDLEVRKIKKKQAVQEKQAALFQAFINTAAAVAEALPNIPLSILAGILGAAQIAAISSRPIPAFKKGTKYAPQGPALVGEAGPELLYTKGRLEYAHKPMVVDLDRGDKVIPAFDTARIMANWNIPVPAFSGPGQMKDNTPLVIDYNRIGHAVGKQLKKLPINSITLNERGYSERQMKQYQVKAYMNNRYNRP